MPHHAASARSVTRPQRSTRSVVTCAGTSLSAMCVVTRTTRSFPVASIIAASPPPARCATSSVRPGYRNPATWSACLCTGPVTIASTTPSRASATALVEHALEHRAQAVAPGVLAVEVVRIAGALGEAREQPAHVARVEGLREAADDTHGFSLNECPPDRRAAEPCEAAPTAT